MLFALLFVATATAAPSAEALAELWAEYQAVIAQHTDHPAKLSAADFKVIARGGIAKHRRRELGPDSAIGIGWTPHSRSAVWVAIIDDIHNTMVSSLTEARLGHSADGTKLLYQRLDLPWPFQDRQWVIAIQNNAGIATASSGRVWERTWQLAANQQAPLAKDEALWVPMISGAWLAIDTPDGTLLVYRAKTTIGGAIPDELVTRWALATLDEMLENVFSRAGEIPEHYRGDHTPIMGGDNVEISLFKKR